MKEFMARRVKRQVNQEDIRKALCKAASIGEFFRLTTMIMTGPFRILHSKRFNFGLKVGSWL